MNGIYIESETLLARKDCVEWVDNMGLEWIDKTPFKEYRTKQTYIGFSEAGFSNATKLSLDQYFTHIPDPEEFCRQVARILEIDEPKFGDVLTEDSIVLDEPDRLHPHKTYRILDSLDGIPFDTRIPLSEWIPPTSVLLVFIEKDNWFRASLESISRTHARIIEEGDRDEYLVRLLDGYWMRIV